MKPILFAVLMLALPGVGQAHCWVGPYSVHGYAGKEDTIGVTFLTGAPAHLTVNTADGKTRQYSLFTESPTDVTATYNWDDEPRQPRHAKFILLAKGDTLAFEGEDHTTCHLSFSTKDNHSGLAISGGPDTAKWEEFIRAAPPPPF